MNANLSESTAVTPVAETPPPAASGQAPTPLAPAPRQEKHFDSVAVREGTRRTRYLAQSILLEEIGTRGLMRAGMVTISLVILMFLGWASITDVEEVAVTKGAVIPAGHIQTIQHLEGGIIADILVSDGSLVEAGQVLLRLDPAGVTAELKQLRARYASLVLEAGRLKAFAAGREPDYSFIVSDPHAGSGHEDLIEDQRIIHDIQKSSLASRQEVIEKQIAQRQEELRSFTEQAQSLRRNIGLLNEERKMREDLFKKGLQPKLAYLGVQREVNKAEGDLQKVLAEERRTREALLEAESRVVELQARAREDALRNLGSLTGELAQVRESLAKALDRVERLELVAPVRGIVTGLTAHTIGGVLPPGGSVLEIVPVGQELLVDSRIATRDIGHIKTGQPVSVKFTTYDFARYGDVPGTLETISATTYLDDKGEPYYKATVTLDRPYVGNNPRQNPILPGMTVQADIRTGTKTLIQYLLKPIYTYADQAFRER